VILMNAFNGFSYFFTSFANTLLLLIHGSVCEKFGISTDHCVASDPRRE
jgi:hypothetical protein